MGSLYTTLVSKLLFPLHERLKRHDSVALRRAMEQSQWWTAEQLHVHQVQQLRALLQAVGTDVPFYRALFSRIGFDPAATQSLADLQRLPLLDKAAIRASTEDMKRTGAAGLARFNTGGSSGEPLIFFIGKARVSHDVAAKWRATRWWDVDIGDRELVVWGSPIELGTQDRVRLVRDRVMRTELLPAFAMSNEKLAAFVQTIRLRRPKMLFGYPSALARIAGFAKQRGDSLDQLGVKVVFVTSERLYEEQRALISEVFGCPIANGYGGRDAGFIAHECPAGGMHITAEDIIVEIVDPKTGANLPAGQTGEIVVTHLATRDFPFIRYRTGDVGAIAGSPCPCGRGLPVLSALEGRTTDFVVAADGTVLHGLALIYVLRDLAGVQSFKIIQHDRLSVQVLVVTDAGFAPDAPARIEQGFRQRLGNAVAVTIDQVETIPAEKSGKFRYVVSHATQSETTVETASHA